MVSFNNEFANEVSKSYGIRTWNLLKIVNKNLLISRNQIQSQYQLFDMITYLGNAPCIVFKWSNKKYNFFCKNSGDW